VNFDTGGSIAGFVTRIDEDCFDIVSFDIMIPDAPEGSEVYIDDEGNTLFPIKNEDVNYIPSTYTFYHNTIRHIQHDASHKLQPKYVKSMMFYKDNVIYKDIEEIEEYEDDVFEAREKRVQKFLKKLRDKALT
jgi:hypothetical protein